jgi:hypothetical protein
MKIDEERITKFVDGILTIIGVGTLLIVMSLIGVVVYVIIRSVFGI